MKCPCRPAFIAGRVVFLENATTAEQPGEVKAEGKEAGSAPGAGGRVRAHPVRGPHAADGERSAAQRRGTI